MRSDLPITGRQSNDPHLFGVRLDPRVAMTIAGVARDGTALGMTPERFAAPTESWQTTDATPPGVADLLELSRRLYSHGCFVYDFVTVAAHYSLIALEAALSLRLNRSDSFAKLIKRAHAEGVIGYDETERLDKAARHLRNDFSHAKQQAIWTPAMASGVIASVHSSIANLFPD